MAFDKDRRIENTAIFHLCRLGYEYLSMKGDSKNTETNIFEEIIIESVIENNPYLEINITFQNLNSKELY
jgi:type I restriction enzyme R subunit